MPAIEIFSGKLPMALLNVVAVQVGDYPLVFLWPSKAAGVTIWHFTRPDGTQGTSILQSTAVSESLGGIELPNWPV